MREGKVSDPTTNVEINPETYPEMCLYTLRVMHGNRKYGGNQEKTQEAARGMIYEDRGLKKGETVVNASAI